MLTIDPRRAAASALVGLALVLGGEARADDAEPARAHAEARATLASIQSLAAHVGRVLRAARGAHDAQVAACADVALTRADVSARLAQAHADRAAVAWAQGDRARARAEMAQLAARAAMVRAAARDADACAAPAHVALEGDVTTVRVVVDPSIPTDVVVYDGDRADR